MPLPYPLFAETMLLGQTFSPGDALVILLLILLEGLLSLDNALVLGMLAKRLPVSQRARALSYGLIGAFVFRAAAVFLAAYLLHWHIVKLLGGGYLVYIAVRHLFFEAKETAAAQDAVVDETGELALIDHATGKPLTEEQEDIEIDARVPIGDAHTLVPKHGANFWWTVLVIELTDIAFAVDSILAAMALVGAATTETVHPKLWVVITGGVLGLILMRFAAAMFIRLLEAFPRFELSAYLLVAVIGSKLLLDWGLNTKEHPHVVDFHSLTSPAFYIFWLVMLICFGIGFIPRSGGHTQKVEEAAKLE